LRKKLLALRQVVQDDFQKNFAFFAISEGRNYSMLVSGSAEGPLGRTDPAPRSIGCDPGGGAPAAEGGGV